MSEREKEILKHFMRIVLYQLHPNFQSYPILDMIEKHESRGDFKGTDYENNENLQMAFYMHKDIVEL